MIDQHAAHGIAAPAVAEQHDGKIAQLIALLHGVERMAEVDDGLRQAAHRIALAAVVAGAVVGEHRVAAAREAIGHVHVRVAAAAQPVRDHHDALRAHTRFVHAGIRVREQVAGKRLPPVGREGSLAHAQAGELVRRTLHERGRLQPRTEVALVHVRRDAERHHTNQEHRRHRHNHKRDAPYTKLPCRPVLHAPAFTAPSRDLQYTRNTRHAIFPECIAL